MGNALKYTFVSLLVIVLLFLAFVYGLYFAGARHISPDWRATTATYPESARVALWRSYGGQGSPEANPMSPPEYAWRWYRVANAAMDRRGNIDPGMTMGYRVARSSDPAGGRSNGDYQLTQVAAAIRASRWPVESQLDTILDNTYFGKGVRGFRQGAMHVFGRPVERLDVAQLQLLLTVEWAPGLYDPWCHRDRLREHALDKARQWHVPTSPQQLEVALATIGPPPAGKRCAGQSK